MQRISACRESARRGPTTETFPILCLTGAVGWWGQSQLLLLPSLILRILKSLANISSSRICGESMVGASSGSRTLFLWASVFTSPTPGPPGASSVERKAEGSEEKLWPNAQEPLLKPWSGNLYKQGVRDPAEREKGGEQRRKAQRKISWSESQGSQTVRGVLRASADIIPTWPTESLYFDSAKKCLTCSPRLNELLRIKTLWNLRAIVFCYSAMISNMLQYLFIIIIILFVRVRKPPSNLSVNHEAHMSQPHSWCSDKLNVFGWIAFLSTSPCSSYLSAQLNQTNSHAARTLLYLAESPSLI